MNGYVFKVRYGIQWDNDHPRDVELDQIERTVAAVHAEDAIRKVREYEVSSTLNSKTKKVQILVLSVTVKSAVEIV